MKPIPPLTKEMLTQYWAAYGGLRKRECYRVYYSDRRVKPLVQGALLGSGLERASCL